MLFKYSLTYNLAILNSKPNLPNTDSIIDFDNYDVYIKGKEEDKGNSSNRHLFKDFYGKEDEVNSGNRHLFEDFYSEQDRWLS